MIITKMTQKDAVTYVIILCKESDLDGCVGVQSIQRDSNGICDTDAFFLVSERWYRKVRNT